MAKKSSAQLQDVAQASISEKVKIRDELARIRKANAEGLLTAEDTVTAAADPANVLHRRFEWDDSKAAHQHRLTQARYLIRTIEVTFPDDPKEQLLPKYVSLMPDRQRSGGGYRETSEVMRSDELLSELENTAKKELAGVLRRYRMLEEFVARVREAAGIPAE